MKGLSIWDGGIPWVTVYHSRMGGASIRMGVNFKLELNVVRGFLGPVFLRHVEAVQLVPMG